MKHLRRKQNEMAKINETRNAIIKIMLLCPSFYTAQKHDIRS